MDSRHRHLVILILELLNSLYISQQTHRSDECCAACCRGDGRSHRPRGRILDQVQRRDRPIVDAHQVHDGRHPAERGDERPSLVEVLGPRGRRGARAIARDRHPSRRSQRGSLTADCLLLSFSYRLKLILLAYLFARFY